MIPSETLATCIFLNTYFPTSPSQYSGKENIVPEHIIIVPKIGRYVELAFKCSIFANI